MKPHVYAYILLIAASIVATVGQVLMRWGGRAAAGVQTTSLWQTAWVSRWWLTGLFIGWFSGLVWALTLRRLPLSFCMPIYTGLVYLMSVGLSFLLLREGLTTIQSLGAALILGGLLLVVWPAS